MAISIKNHEDRIRTLENNHLTRIYNPVTDPSKKVKVIKGYPATFTNEAIKTGKYLAIDYTTWDDANTNTIHSCIIPMLTFRDIKPHYTQDTYMDNTSQGLKITATGNTLKFEEYNYGIGASAIWLFYVAIFKYYLNIVLGWVM